MDVASQNKSFSLKEKLFAFVELGRPVEWSKSLLNMFLATMIAFYVFGAQLDFFIFVLGFIAVAFLWSGLYALNDYTDHRIDLLHEVKKKRPLPSGKLSPRQGLAFSMILIVISFLIALTLGGGLIVLCLLAMLVNQLLYTMKPFRLKSRKVFDVISGSMVNPFFRYFSGMVLFVPAGILLTTFNPILPIIFVVGIQFAGYSLYRLFSKKHDKKVNMKSSVALLPETLIKNVSYFVMAIAALSYIGILVNGATLKIKFLGYLPPQYLIAVVIVIAFAPLLKGAVVSPDKADMKKSYRLIYTANIIFVLANALVFFLFP